MKQFVSLFFATITFLTLLFISLPALAQGLAPSNPSPVVQLAWNPSPSPGVTNYSVYVGAASLQYTSRIDCGTNLTLTVTNLARGVASYFNITATAVGLECGFCGELTYTPIAPPLCPTWKPIVILIVENTPSLNLTNWSTLATLSLSANQVSQFYRTRLAVAQ